MAKRELLLPLIMLSTCICKGLASMSGDILCTAVLVGVDRAASLRIPGEA